MESKKLFEEINDLRVTHGAGAKLEQIENRWCVGRFAWGERPFDPRHLGTQHPPEGRLTTAPTSELIHQTAET